jgi:hypothetical protein
MLTPEAIQNIVTEEKLTPQDVIQIPKRFFDGLSSFGFEILDRPVE